jgi:preprotein translocase subunit YajC
VEALGSLLPFLLILVAFYLLMIRPARTRARAATQMQNSLTPGLEVMTTSGLFATVVAVEDDAVALQVAPGVTMRFAKPAVARILTANESADDGSEDVDDTASGSDDRPAR